MATYEKRIGASGKITWRARVRRLSGPWLTKSHSTKKAAEEWAQAIESSPMPRNAIGIVEIAKMRP
ncbi:MAG: hypothetical protein H7X76_07225 [Prolixibacteraceae bacterium]|nr:hypothetical protein [Burkholderiales bacterium]